MVFANNERTLTIILNLLKRTVCEKFQKNIQSRLMTATYPTSRKYWQLQSTLILFFIILTTALAADGFCNSHSQFLQLHLSHFHISLLLKLKLKYYQYYLGVLTNKNNKTLFTAYYWVDTRARNGVPSTALRGGTDSDGDAIYVGRAFHDGDWLPAKVIPNKDVAYIAYGGDEHEKCEYQVKRRIQSFKSSNHADSGIIFQKIHTTYYGNQKTLSFCIFSLVKDIFQ